MHARKAARVRRPGPTPLRLALLVCWAAFLLPAPLPTTPAAAQRRRNQRPVKRTPAPPPAATPTPTSCPTFAVNVPCPKGNFKVGDTITFEAEFVPPKPQGTPSYSWEVNPASLTPLNTSGTSITIRTTSADRQVMATVTVNYGPGCTPQSRSSCWVQIKEQQTAALVTVIPAGARDEILKSRLDLAAEEALSDADNVLYLITHEAKGSRGVERGAADGVDGGPLYASATNAGGPFAGGMFGGFALGDRAAATLPASGAQDAASLPAQATPSAQETAVRARAYLRGKGIPPSRIIIIPGAPRCEPAVEVFVASSGATPPTGTGDERPCENGGDELGLLWDVLPQSVVGDLFGKRVRKRYYVIDVRIENRSASEFQLTGFGFRLGLPTAPVLPSADRTTVRGTILKEQRDGLRARSSRLIQTTGFLMTGFIPFFKADSRRADFAHLTSVFTNPLEIGFDLFFPDKTPLHLSALEAMTWDDGPRSVVSIPSFGRYKTYIFFPKERLKPDKPDHDTPNAVRARLSHLVMMGATVERVNTITKVQP
jgi:hypothetical protein